MIHRFGLEEDVSNEAFQSVHATYRSETEIRNSPLAIHDPDSADIKLVRQLADEMVNISGAEVKLFVRTDNADYDAVWDEDPDPTYWSPILLKGFFKPQPIEAELQKWGVDVKNKTEIVFSHREIHEKLGERMVRVGDVLQLPFNSTPIKLKNYRVVNASPSGNYRYIWLYLTCNLELLTADISVRPEEDMVDEVNEEASGTYRESL